MAMFILAFVYRIPNSYLEEMIVTKQQEKAFEIGLALKQYSLDHAGNYPAGKSSTAIFQQLLDQKYVTDPTLFYLPMRGKSKPVGTILEPDNVCWDVTNSVRTDDSDSLPLVFTTGYKLQYRPKGDALPLTHVSTIYLILTRKNGAIDIRTSVAKGVVPLAILSSFDTKGRTYQQLTPDGPLP
jgi:hypothetical protein